MAVRRDRGSHQSPGRQALCEGGDHILSGSWGRRVLWGPLLWLGRQHLQPGPAQGTVGVEGLLHRQTMSRGAPGPRGSPHGPESEEQSVTVSLRVSAENGSVTQECLVCSRIRCSCSLSFRCRAARRPAVGQWALGWPGVWHGSRAGEGKASSVTPRVCVSWGRGRVVRRVPRGTALCCRSGVQRVPRTCR